MKKLPKKYNVNLVVRSYEDKDGKEKRVWQTVGQINLWDSNGTLELYGFDGVKTLSVFEQKSK